jgi:hypothetical protein
MKAPLIATLAKNEKATRRNVAYTFQINQRKKKQRDAMRQRFPADCDSERQELLSFVANY